MSQTSKKPLSDAAVRTAKSGAVLVDTAPHTGLRLQAGKSTKTWIYRFRLSDGRLRQLTLGHYPGMTLAGAREAVTAAKAIRDQGLDPAEAKAAEKRAAAAAQAAEARAVLGRRTLGQLIEDYTSEHLVKRRRPDEAKRMLEKEVPAALRARPAAEIRRSEIQALLDSIVRRPAPRIAIMLRSELRGVWSHAILRDRLPQDTANPVTDTRVPRTVSRDRVLSDAELRSFLSWLPTANVSQAVKDALMITLYTGARSGEVVAMRWADLDIEAAEWRIPGATRKTGAAHLVFLAPLIVALLKRRKELVGKGCAWVFPRPRDTKMHINQKTLTWQVLKSGRAGLAPWTNHDLRRTCATGIARLGFHRELVSRILGHYGRGATAIYDRHRRDAEAKEAWTVWADQLAVLAQPTVRPIARRTETAA
jgi:integrase